MRPKWRAGGLGEISEGNLSAIHLITDAIIPTQREDFCEQCV